MTSSTVSASLSPLRLATIGAVAALAVAAGAVAGAFLMNGEQAGLGSGASYVPGDAPFYVEVRVVPSDAQDAALREFLGHFPPIEGIDLGQPLSEQMVEHLDEMLAADGVNLTWSEDIAPWFDGRVGFALTSFDVESTMSSESIPPTVALLGVTDEAAAAGAIDRILAESGAPAPTETQHAGVTINTVGGDEPGAWALTADQLILGTDETAIIAALDAHADPSSTLSANADASRLAEALPSDWLAFVFYDMTGLMADAFEAMPADDTGSADAMRAIIEGQPLRGAMAVSAGGDRLVLDAVSDAPSGAFAVENADRGLADEVPGDALYYSEASNIGSALAGVIGPLKDSLAQVPEVADQIVQLEAAMGADLEELVSWIGDGAAVAGFDGSEPYAGAVLVADDPDAAERRLDQLAAFAELGAVEGGIGVTVEEAQVGDASVTTLCWRDPGAVDLELPIAPEVCLQWAVPGDRVLIGVGETFVGRALALDSGSSLAAQARFSSAVAEMGGSSNAGMTWVDLAGAMAAVEAQLGTIDEMFGTPDVSEAMAWLDPLDQVISVSRLDGDLLVQRAALIVE